MTTTRTAIRFAAFAACSVLLPAHAHHSYGMFDSCKPTTLEGEINSVQWVNPHIVISLRTQDVDDYRIEWYNLLQLERERHRNRNAERRRVTVQAACGTRSFSRCSPNPRPRWSLSCPGTSRILRGWLLGAESTARRRHPPAWLAAAARRSARR